MVQHGRLIGPLRVRLLVVGLVTAAVVGLALAAPSSPGTSANSAPTVTAAAALTAPAPVIARTRLATTRAWLTVRRTSRYRGVVRVHMDVLRHGSWHSAGSRRVTDVFWYVATGPGALCTWSVAESAPSGQASPPVAVTRPVAVRLLHGPALGCSPRTFHFHDERGRLVRGR